MANCCVYYLFFSYSAAAVIYLIIGSFAASGNVAVLTEHLRTDKCDTGRNDTVECITSEEKDNVKGRTSAQYFLASGISLGISLPLFLFCIINKPKGYIDLPQNINNKEANIMQIEEEDDIIKNQNKNDTLPIELAKQLKDSDTGTEEGMKEVIN